MDAVISNIIQVNRSPELSPWFLAQLEQQLEAGLYQNNPEELFKPICSYLQDYIANSGISTVVVGMSGGIDSAVTAMLFQRAGWTVIPVVLPIHQDPAETDRGLETCRAMMLEPVVLDLSDQYDHMVDCLGQVDESLWDSRSHQSRVRKGNIRARLRMTTLYNIAHQHSGLVASTDNFSEMAAGFWTLHGDVGDIAPIQCLTKSWEVPLLAEYLGVPLSTRNAIPTDGLGISNSDEDQLGFSYLEFDIGVFAMMHVKDIQGALQNASQADCDMLDKIRDRVKRTVFKRRCPINLDHPTHATRYISLTQLDDLLGT